MPSNTTLLLRNGQSLFFLLHKCEPRKQSYAIYNKREMWAISLDLLLDFPFYFLYVLFRGNFVYNTVIHLGSVRKIEHKSLAYCSEDRSFTDILLQILPNRIYREREIEHSEI